MHLSPIYYIIYAFLFLKNIAIKTKRYLNRLNTTKKKNLCTELTLSVHSFFPSDLLNNTSTVPLTLNTAQIDLLVLTASLGV